MTTRKAPAKKKAPAKAKTPAVAPEAPVAAPERVTCVLGPNSPAGALVVGNVRIEAKKPGSISRADFERLRGDYDLREVEGG